MPHIRHLPIKKALHRHELVTMARFVSRSLSSYLFLSHSLSLAKKLATLFCYANIYTTFLCYCHARCVRQSQSQFRVITGRRGHYHYTVAIWTLFNFRSLCSNCSHDEREIFGSKLCDTLTVPHPQYPCFNYVTNCRTFSHPIASLMTFLQRRY